MIDIKELIDDLGGPKSVAGGGLVFVFLSLAASNAMDSYAERITTVERRAATNSERIAAEVTRLELRVTRIEEFVAQGPRFSREDGAALENRISRIERLIDNHK